MYHRSIACTENFLVPAEKTKEIRELGDSSEPFQAMSLKVSRELENLSIKRQAN